MAIKNYPLFWEGKGKGILQSQKIEAKDFEEKENPQSTDDSAQQVFKIQILLTFSKPHIGSLVERHGILKKSMQVAILEMYCGLSSVDRGFF